MKNPHSEGRDLYLRQRQSLLLSKETSLVEFDLLRSGVRMPRLDCWPDNPYTLFVSSVSLMPNCHVWIADLKTRLPTISVPICKPDQDVVLDIQPMIDDIYTPSKYWRSIDYTKPITPPLSADDAAWLDQQLRSRG